MKTSLSNKPSANIKLIEKCLTFIYPVILLITFIKTYDEVYDTKLNLGGDNAAYYILGSAISSGEGYTNTHFQDKTAHRHFPVGYPLVIAGISTFFPNDIQAIKKSNGVFLFISIGVLFLIGSNLTNPHLAFIACLYSLFNFHLLTFSFIMMSEIPFLFFFHLVLWVFMKTDLSLPIYKNWRFLFLILLVSICYHIRTIGLAVLLGLFINLIWQKKWQYGFSVIIGFITVGLPWYLRNRQLGANYVNQLIYKNPYRPELGIMKPIDWLERAWTNFERYIVTDIPNSLMNVPRSFEPTDSTTIAMWSVGIIIVFLVMYGLFRLEKQMCILLFLTLSAFFGILLIWPDVWLGQRFIIPLLPIFILLLSNGVFHVLHKLTCRLNANFRITSIFMLLLGIVFLNLYSKYPLSILQQRAKSSYPSAYRNYFELATWLKANTESKSVVCCRKQNLFHLFSQQFVTGYKYTQNAEEQIEYLKSKNVEYVILEKLGYSSTNRYLVPTIKKYPHKFKAIKKLPEPDSYLIKFQPDIGYKGSWKDGQKHGQGTFTWENGQTFSGNWELGKRKGPGSITFPSGFILKGTWENDQLNGVSEIESKSGQVIEKRLYKNDEVIKILGK